MPSLNNQTHPNELNLLPFTPLTSAELKAIDDLTVNFDQFAQSVIEECYLLPLPENISSQPLVPKIKSNFKDGVLEREVHGSMHAGRCTNMSEVLLPFLKENLPVYLSEVLRDMALLLNLNEQQLLTLAKAAIICHDSKRRNEGRDFWDAQSGLYCKMRLLALGINPAIATWLSLALAFKDNPEEFEAKLKAQNIMPPQISSFDFLRKLIYLADCFDIMRCTPVFDFAFVLEAVEKLTEYKNNVAKIQGNLIQLGINIFHLINSHQDMLTASSLKLPGGTLLEMNQHFRHFSHQEKIKYEHADNVLAAIRYSMSKIPYFAAYLGMPSTIVPSLYNGPVGFHPFLHGTSTVLFSVLPATGWQLQGPLAMLAHYQRAPFGGEIIQGGLDSWAQDCQPCFGRLHIRSTIEGHVSNEYTLDKIIQKYAGQNIMPTQQLQAALSAAVQEAPKMAFSNINILRVYIARAKQLGLNLVAAPEKLMQQAQATIQIFYLILFLGKYLFSNMDFIKNLGNQYENFQEAARREFKFRRLLQKVIDQKLDLKAIYHHPTPENLKKVLGLLTFAKSKLDQESQTNKVERLYFIKAYSLRLYSWIKTIKIKIQQVWSWLRQGHMKYQADTALIYPATLINQGHEPKTMESEDLTFLGNYLHQGQSFSEIIRSYLVWGNLKAEFFRKLESSTLNYLKIFEQRVQELQSLLKVNPITIALTAKERKFLINPFPLILLLENEAKMKITRFRTQEYRATENLKFGVDITMVATDTPEHAKSVEQFLGEHQIQNVEVVLFDHLRAMQKAGRRLAKSEIPTIAMPISIPNLPL